MLQRREFVLAIGAAATAPAGALSPSEGSKKSYRIGLLHSESASAIPSRIQALRDGLRDFGYVEGRNLVIEFRWAEGDDRRLPVLAADLVRLNVDVIVTTATQPVLVAKQATVSIPIVFATVGDAVATGVVASLAHPGGNATGSTFFSPEIMAKRLELSKRVIPRLARAAVLLHPDSTLGTAVLSAMRPTASALGIEIQRFDARDAGELEATFAAMSREGMQAMVMLDHPRFIAHRKQIAELALARRIAAIGYDELAESGGLFGYGVNFSDLWRRVAYFVDRIFKGARPDQLPVEQATKFDFVVNARTARALGMLIPNSILVSADRVIE
jgi:putative ABC transport system substrate-binding protein